MKKIKFLAIAILAITSLSTYAQAPSQQEIDNAIKACEVKRDAQFNEMKEMVDEEKAKTYADHSFEMMKIDTIKNLKLSYATSTMSIALALEEAIFEYQDLEKKYTKLLHDKLTAEEQSALVNSDNAFTEYVNCTIELIKSVYTPERSGSYSVVEQNFAILEIYKARAEQMFGCYYAM